MIAKMEEEKKTKVEEESKTPSALDRFKAPSKRRKH